VAQVTVCLAALLRQSGIAPAADIPLALARLAVETPYWADLARALQAEAAADHATARQIVATLAVLATRVEMPRSHEQMPDDPARKVSSKAAAAKDTSHFHAPFAGVALVLPHLAEDAIGRAFDGRDVLAALADLARSDLFPAPETSGFLQALSGTERKDAPPDRPNTRDLLFIPAARHNMILQAKPGAPRLAAWAMARFAATLPGLGASSLGFLQRQFFHRSGEVWIDRDHIMLRLDPVPLRAVLELAGRLGPDLARIDWLMRQSLTIRCDQGV
jgi:hypothetical protein